MTRDLLTLICFDELCKMARSVPLKVGRSTSTRSPSLVSKRVKKIYGIDTMNSSIWLDSHLINELNDGNKILEFDGELRNLFVNFSIE